MGRWLTLLALCALAGCGNDPAAQAPAIDKPPALTPAPLSDTEPAPATLVGEWRVAGIGGQDVNLPHGISATINRDRIEITSSCIVLGWRYAYAQGELQTEPLPSQGCERTLDHVEESLLHALTGARGARLTSANGVELYGEGPTVLLFSQ